MSHSEVLASAAFCTGIGQISAARIDAWASELTGAERDRLEGFQSLRRRQFICARHVLRQLLQYKTQRTSYVVQSTCGAPSLPELGLYCSISHSYDTVLVAFSKYPIGVDVESLASPRARRRDCRKLVAALFPLAEQQYFAQLSPVDQIEWFYRQWTAREAIVKLQGGGNVLSAVEVPSEGVVPLTMVMGDSVIAIAQDQVIPQPTLYACDSLANLALGEPLTFSTIAKDSESVGNQGNLEYASQY